MVKHSKESLEFIKKLREKSPNTVGKAKTDAALVRSYQNDHGGRIICALITMVVAVMNLVDPIGENRIYFGIIMMTFSLIILIYSIIKYRQGDEFRKEWIAHWKNVTKDVKKMSFDELNDMAKWL